MARAVRSTPYRDGGGTQRPNTRMPDHERLAGGLVPGSNRTARIISGYRAGRGAAHRGGCGPIRLAVAARAPHRPGCGPVRVAGAAAAGFSAAAGGAGAARQVLAPTA